MNVDHLQVNLVFVQAGYKTLDFDYEFWTQSCGVQCVGVKRGGGWVWSEFLKILWALDGEVAPEEQDVDI